jgi:hypothetical protein
MATRDILRTTLVTPSLYPAARTNGTFTGNAVDLRGYDGAMIAVSFGAYTDGTHTPTIVQSVDGVTFVPCVYGTDLDAATNLAAVSSSAGANTVQQIGYIGSQRYVAVVMTVSGATSGALSSGNVVAGYPRSAPTQ